MESSSFISHTENGGKNTASLIHDQLTQPDLEMNSFLSTDNIEYGDHIHEDILSTLPNSDLFFVVIEPLTIGSRWVRWEFEILHLKILGEIYFDNSDHGRFMYFPQVNMPINKNTILAITNTRNEIKKYLLELNK